MRWVAASILLFIAVYTVVTLRYRKPGRPFEPARDLTERAAAERLRGLGYQRLPVDFEQPAVPLTAAQLRGAGSAAGRGLPAAFAGALGTGPALPAAVTQLLAAGDAPAGSRYRLQFTCTQPDFKTQVGGALLYRRDRELFLLPVCERIPGRLLARSQDATVLATFSVQSLPPGRYALSILGRSASQHCTFTVK
ncbi:MAG: hypothetical protein A3G75_01120 [Verrucomicrobia bacterium RIFCSPLOWO2_12_FULL_64_8]|nr:MAG: hypothetical protein A3G75_01120 [Verrucomicrobia bacterium RIFCSPLOWO2_12_FULL_64_8]